MNDLLGRLADLPPRMRLVHHEPETLRYLRAQLRFDYLLDRGSIVGSRLVELHPEAEEIALWAPSPSGKGYGYYACLRVFYWEAQPSLALLFCFYDGTEGSVGLKSLSAALTYALSQGFLEVKNV